MTLSQFLIGYDQERSQSVAVEAAFTRLAPFFGNTMEVRRKAARDAVKSLVLKDPLPKPTATDQYALALSWVASTATLPRYASLDDKHVGDLNEMVQKIEEYLADASRKRPLNFLMMAPPGSGKSHLIDCVSQALVEQHVAAHSFNMATMSAPDDLGTPLDEARNLKVADKHPLLFLDEFDAFPDNYGLLLPLLWDGKIGLRHRTITLGKAVVVMAGSNRLLPLALEEAQSMRAGASAHEDPKTKSALDGPNAKLVDLISRINGAVVSIPPLDEGDGKQGRPFDKVAIAVELLKVRFPKVRRVPLALLAFIGRTRFRYDVRSITCVIDHIAAPPAEAPTDLLLKHMPKALASAEGIEKSNLVYHLIDNQAKVAGVSSQAKAAGVFELWQRLSKHDALVPVTPPDIPEPRSDDERRRFIDYAMSVLYA